MIAEPTEPIFHNCADIKIVKSASPLQSPTWYGRDQSRARLRALARSH